LINCTESKAPKEKPEIVFSGAGDISSEGNEFADIFASTLCKREDERRYIRIRPFMAELKDRLLHRLPVCIYREVLGHIINKVSYG